MVKKLNLRPIVGILSCIITGISAAALAITFIYNTKFTQIGAIRGSAMGLVLISGISLFSSPERLRVFLYLLAVSLMHALQFFCLLLLIAVLGRLFAAGRIDPASLFLVVGIGLLFPCRALVKKLDRAPRTGQRDQNEEL